METLVGICEVPVCDMRNVIEPAGEPLLQQEREI